MGPWCFFLHCLVICTANEIYDHLIGDTLWGYLYCLRHMSQDWICQIINCARHCVKLRSRLYRHWQWLLKTYCYIHRLSVHSLTLTWDLASTEFKHWPVEVFQNLIVLSFVPPPVARRFDCHGHQAKAFCTKKKEAKRKRKSSQVTRALRSYSL